MIDQVHELMPELFTKSEIIILDFNQIPSGLPEFKNIKKFFADCHLNGVDPKLPQNRQRFNDSFLDKTNKRYLIGRYSEDRIEMLRGSRIAEEGRTIHLGVDIFSKNLETVYAPCDSQVVMTGKEEGAHSFGNYLILQLHCALFNTFLFLGHLSKTHVRTGKVMKGEEIARLGDYIDNENGGWSRHLHVQFMQDLPQSGQTPIGYSTLADLKKNMMHYPDPSSLIGLL